MDNRTMLLKCLSAARFACVETRLYLDTHPCDQEAAEALARYTKQAQELESRFEQCFGPINGMPGCSADVNWVCDPWPWNYGFTG